MNTAYYWYRPHPYFSNFYPGKILNLLADTNLFYKYLPDTSQIALAKKHFPNGLSPHGLSMLCSRKTSATAFHELITEVIFELVRQLDYPDAPSRMTSLYASQTIEQAQKWRSLWQKNFGDMLGQTGESLWEIEYNTNANLYDANFLNIMPEDEFSYTYALEFAHKYWQGSMSENPLPELLIPYPVTIVRMIRDIVSE